MSKKKKFKVGDKIIDFGEVYKIFKVKKQKTLDGTKQKVIFFKPFFKIEEDETLVCSIPLKNIKKTNIRKPISKNELKKILKNLAKKTKIEEPTNLNKAKIILNSNNVYKTAQILNRLWSEKNDQTKNFTKSKKKVFELSMKRLVQEVALVSNLPLKKAKDEIMAALKKTKK